MGKLFNLSAAAKDRISRAMKARYNGPGGARLRRIDEANGRKALGSTWGKGK